MFDAIETQFEDSQNISNNGYLKIQEVPTPNSCSLCGCEQRSHGMSWVKIAGRENGYHLYEAPDDALRLARMKARRN